MRSNAATLPCPCFIQLTSKKLAIKSARHMTICKIIGYITLKKYNTSGIIHNDTNMSRHQESGHLLLQIRVHTVFYLYLGPKTISKIVCNNQAHANTTFDKSWPWQGLCQAIRPIHGCGHINEAQPTLSDPMSQPTVYRLHMLRPFGVPLLGQ